MNKKIQIRITEEDISMFQELIDEQGEPFTWTFDGVDVEFIKYIAPIEKLKEMNK